jgi:hypothetical protein
MTHRTAFILNLATSGMAFVQAIVDAISGKYASAYLLSLVFGVFLAVSAHCLLRHFEVQEAVSFQ